MEEDEDVVLVVECSACGTPARLSSGDSRGVTCRQCRAVLPRAFVEITNGYVYALVNACMPGLVKIGFTEITVEERARQLDGSSGVPERFEILGYFGSDAPREHEARVHKVLGPFRHNRNREFFRVEDLLALHAIADAVGRAPVYVRADVAGAFEKLMTVRGRGREVLGDRERVRPAAEAVVQEREAPAGPRFGVRFEGSMVRRLRDALEIVERGTSREEVTAAEREILRLIPEAGSLEEAVSRAVWLVGQSAPVV